MTTKKEDGKGRLGLKGATGKTRRQEAGADTGTDPRVAGRLAQADDFRGKNSVQHLTA